MSGLILLSGFEPFGGEKTNPSWEVAERLDGRQFGAATVKATRLPVNCQRATATIMKTIAEMRPAAVLGLGQAMGRFVLSLEKVALNLADERAVRETDGGLDGKPVIASGPDAYFTRLPLKAMMAALHHRGVPSAMSLSAGVYVCNAVMYATLHALRRRPRVPAGFIHLPYETAQATRRVAPSMPLELMITGIEAVLGVVVAA